MDKAAKQFSVSIEDSKYIIISQEAGYMEEDDYIRLHPEQVDLLIKWLNEAKAELLKGVD